MGCCQARDKHPQEDDPQHSYKSSSPSLCPADAELDAIETYAMALLGTKEGWRIDFDQSPLLIRHLNVCNPTIGVQIPPRSESDLLLYPVHTSNRPTSADRRNGEGKLTYEMGQ